MARASVTGLEFRIVRTKSGYCGFVAGSGGVTRCMLPLPTRAGLRDRLLGAAPEARENKSLMPALAADLERFFRGEATPFKGAKLDMTGITPFRTAVYRELRKVRFGRKVTYGELAARAGSPGAARGVGGAMAANPFPPIVPCHRVLGSNGKLTGFSAPGGLELKRRMIEAEA